MSEAKDAKRRTNEDGAPADVEETEDAAPVKKEIEMRDGEPVCPITGLTWSEFKRADWGGTRRGLSDDD